MRRKFTFLLILLSGVLAGFAQTTDKSLKEALDLLTKEKKTRFIFERAVVDGLQVKYDWNSVKDKKAQDVLNELLSQVGLNAVPVGNNYFAIRKSKKPANNNSTDQTIRTATISLPQDSLKPSGGAVVVVSGVVREKGTRKPVEGATVQVAPYGLFAITDKEGRYAVKDVPVSRVRISVSGLSMIGEERQVNLATAYERIQVFELTANALGLKEVFVVAKENRQGATSSIISKTAIEHLQAVSLADILQLLPGGLATNPDLTGVNQASIRQIKPDNMGSLGTAVLINGAPVSNNANLQVTNTSTGGAGASFATSSGGGVDLRQITANNIESLEVIRGIPSVEYGDLTSGAILLKTKAGKEPLTIKARINPRITQLAGSKGFDLGGKAGSIYADIDYTRSFDDQRFEYQGYHRLSGNLLYSRKFGRKQNFSSNTSLSYAMNLDEQKLDPDDKRYQYKRSAKDISYRFNTYGKWDLNKKFSRQIQYNLSVNYSEQKGYQQQLLSGAIYPLSFETTDITKEGQFVPSEYLSQLWIDGRPLNVFAKISNTFFLRNNWLNQRVLMGADWKTDANYGTGKTYDLNRPPQMQGGNGARPRSYKDIPALNQLGFYLEDQLIAKIFGRRMTLQAGLRFDNIQPTGIWTSKMNTLLTPRINWNYELVKDFNIRAGWGITAKAPTLLYLYPQNAYFDLVNYNRYSSNPDEALVYLTTRVFNSENPDLKLMKTNKSELGFDWNIDKKKRLTVTAYHEKTQNGYAFDVAPWSIKIVPVEMYREISRPVGQKPVVEMNTDSFVNYIADYSVPMNKFTSINKGVEFDFDMGRFDAIRTSFVLNGAFMQSKRIANDITIIKRQFSGKDPLRIAVYDKGRGVERERFNTTLRVTHNIPEFRLIVTLTAQTIWWEKERNIGYDSIPIGSIARETGTLSWFTKDEKTALANAAVKDREMVESFAAGYHLQEKWDPLWLFNLRLNKEIGKGISFAFFANNIFSSQKLERSDRYPTTHLRRNPELFFGTEVTIKL